MFVEMMHLSITHPRVYTTYSLLCPICINKLTASALHDFQPDLFTAPGDVTSKYLADTMILLHQTISVIY